MLFEEAEALLEKWKHPDPYHAPTAPGGQFPHSPSIASILNYVRSGSKFERNIPAPILNRKCISNSL